MRERKPLPRERKHSDDFDFNAYPIVDVGIDEKDAEEEKLTEEKPAEEKTIFDLTEQADYDFLDPITWEEMKNPHIDSKGNSFEKHPEFDAEGNRLAPQGIMRWGRDIYGGEDAKEINEEDLIPNHALKNLKKEFDEFRKKRLDSYYKNKTIETIDLLQNYLRVLKKPALLAQQKNKMILEKLLASKVWPFGAICPITKKLIKEPVIAPSGVTYERDAIRTHLVNSPKDPVTRTPLTLDELIPNHRLHTTLSLFKKAGVSVRGLKDDFRTIRSFLIEISKELASKETDPVVARLAVLNKPPVMTKIWRGIRAQRKNIKRGVLFYMAADVIQKFFRVGEFEIFSDLSAGSLIPSDPVIGPVVAAVANPIVIGLSTIPVAWNLSTDNWSARVTRDLCINNISYDSPSLENPCLRAIEFGVRAKNYELLASLSHIPAYNEEIIKAIESGKNTRLHYLTFYKKDILKKNPFYLDFAIKEKQTATLFSLLEFGVSPDRNHETCADSIYFRDREVIGEVFFNNTGQYEISPLRYAIRENFRMGVKHLIERGATLTEEILREVLLQNNHNAVIQILSKNKSLASVSLIREMIQKNEEGAILLIHHGAAEMNEEILKDAISVRNGRLINYVIHANKSLLTLKLMKELQINDDEGFRFLMKECLYLTQEFLLEAAKTQNGEIVEFMFANNERLKKVDLDNLIMKNPKAAQLLIEKGAYVYQPQLIQAAWLKDPGLIGAILSRNRDLADQNFMIKMIHTNPEVARILIEKDAPLSPEILRQAVISENTEFINLIASHIDGSELLNQMVKTDNTKAAELLIKAGVEIHWWTLREAIYKQDMNLVKLMLVRDKRLVNLDTMRPIIYGKPLVIEFLLSLDKNLVIDLHKQGLQTVKIILSNPDIPVPVQTRLLKLLIEINLPADELRNGQALSQAIDMMLTSPSQEKLDLIKMLLEHGNNPNSIEDRLFVALVPHDKNPELIRLLAEHGFDHRGKKAGDLTLKPASSLLSSSTSRFFSSDKKADEASKTTPSLSLGER